MRTRCPGRRTGLPWEAEDGAWQRTDLTPAAQVLPTDELAEPKKSHRQSHRKKVLPEIYLTRLLSTKVGPAASPRSEGQLSTCLGGARALPAWSQRGSQGERLRA